MKTVAPFTRRVLEVGGTALRARHPEFVEAYERALGESGRDAEAAIRAVRELATPGFGRWRCLIEALVELRLVLVDFETSLRAYDTPLPDAVREQWARMSHNNTYVALEALIERVQTLGKASAGALQVPASVVAALEERVDYLHAHVARARDPILRGGAVAAMRGERFPEVVAILGGMPDAKAIPDGFAGLQKAWSDCARQHALAIAAEIDAVIGDLDAAIPWAAVREDASRG